jgi:hypothetical protein
MPAITRWFIKTSFVYFLLALVIGVIIGVQALGTFSFPAANLYPTYVHVFVEGWLTMLIIGVAIWMFPKYTIEKPRGNEALSWLTYILFNIGLALRILSEPFAGVKGYSTSLLAAVLIVAAGLQWLGGITFVINAWGRVKVK